MPRLFLFSLFALAFAIPVCRGALPSMPEPIAVPLYETPAGHGLKETLEERGNAQRPDRKYEGVTKSLLTIYQPIAKVPRTAGVVICPGGGYGALAYDKEGVAVAEWFRERGVVAGVLKYRVGGGANRHPIPMQDVQTALQVMRARSSELGFPGNKLGVMGFSAGGHLAATAATQFVVPRGGDGPDGQSSRPDFAVLVYPVISMKQDVTHSGSRRNLLGAKATAEAVVAQSADQNVTKDTPPTMLIHAADDASVPVENAMLFYRACRKHGVPAEMHLYEEGGHGVGMWIKGKPMEHWPKTMAEWMRQHGWMN